MIIQTTRWGGVDIEDSRIMRFPDGLTHPQLTSFILLEEPTGSNDSPVFFWLQSLQDPECAYFVTDPKFFDPSYEIELTPEILAKLESANAENIFVLCMVGKKDQTIIGNFQKPLVIDANSWIAMQHDSPNPSHADDQSLVAFALTAEGPKLCMPAASWLNQRTM